CATCPAPAAPARNCPPLERFGPIINEYRQRCSASWGGTRLKWVRRAVFLEEIVVMSFATRPRGARLRSSRVRSVASCIVETLEARSLLSANVLTYHNDPASTGQNLNETKLTPT